ncbi:SOS response-associated peptidase [Sphingomonas sanguinis]|uniref:SOS response-associated peptidase n=1 Tax=Sphingomonas sanguinis TaxID=33051 RepID=A0ABU5LSS1_9SPHN|nr:hypothetical protein [Sphingomonas sanguinis]MDZ7282988.1 SOS response-associated peptidase [Sphingomonas sanguinis]
MPFHLADGLRGGVMTMMEPIWRPSTGDRATLDRTAEALCADFAIAWTARASWGTWDQLADLRAGHPAFVIRHTAEGNGLDTQRWGIGEGREATTRIPGLSLPWWRRLAERPAQRCLIPLTACTLAASGLPGRDRRATWFALAEEPVFTVAGLWRESGDARCFALVECENGDRSPMPMVVAAADRERWLRGSIEDIAALQRPCPPEALRIGLPRPAAPVYPPSQVPF